MGIAVDIHRAGKTMVACSPYPIRSFGPSGPRRTRTNREARSSLAASSPSCSSAVASPPRTLRMCCARPKGLDPAIGGLIQGPPLSAVLVCRRIGSLLCRARRQRTGVELRLFRGWAEPAI